jgi:DNA-binding MarR family transcriptional regulator
MPAQEEPTTAGAESTSREELLQALGHAVRANQRATDAVDEAATQALGLNRTDGRCLDILDQHGQMSAGELARQSELTTGAITAVIDRLERIGYVRRVADPSDRRRVLVGPTQKAREDSWELFGPLADTVRPMLSGYTDEDLQLLIDFHRMSREVQERHAAWIRAHELRSG